MRSMYAREVSILSRSSHSEAYVNQKMWITQKRCHFLFNKQETFAY